MRERLLDAAERLVQDRGLNAVSFQQLADAVGLSKPSVFHHFPSREALAQALVRRCHDEYGAAYDQVIGLDSPAPVKLAQMAALSAEGLRNDRLCLLAALGNSVATLAPSVRDDLRLTTSATIDRLTRVFEQGRREGSLRYEGSPADAAAAFLAMLQGLQVLARAKREPELLLRAATAAIESLAT